VNVYLATLGCRLNEAEVSSWSRTLSADGHAVVTGPESAELVVVNSCAVTAEASRKSRKLVSGLHRRNPDAKLVLTGCYSELEPERAAEQAGVDLVVGNVDKEKLVQIALDNLDFDVVSRSADAPAGHHAFREERTRAFVKVQDGCRNRCTFCIVTIARGNERSRTIDDVVAEVDLLVQRGFREAVLTGVHLGGYGSDIGCELRELVRAVLDRTEIERLRLSSLEPWDLPEGFGELWRDPRLMPHLHLPLQSGCDATLKRMARRCSTESYRRLIGEMRSSIEDLVVTTDIIVGFPGETDEEWRQSLDYVGEIGFAHVHAFAYSRREGTTAARLPGHLPGDIKKQRSRELRDLAADMKRTYFAGFIGSAREVLWEGEGEVAADGSRRHFGFTDNYLRVSTCVPAGAPSLENRITKTRLRMTTDGETQWLDGEIF